MNCSDKFKNWTIEYKNIVDSTMNEIQKDIYKSYSNIAILSSEQIKGRGRGQNEWVSEKGNFYASIKTKTSLSNKHFIVSYVIGIIMYDVIEKYINKKNRIIIKWPNDILVDRKKIAGILIEMNTFGNKVEDIVVGIGLNIKSCPIVKKYETTCLHRESNIKTDVKIIIKQILNCYDKWKKHLSTETNNIQFIIDQWMKRSFAVGTVVRIKKDNKLVKGIYEGIDLDGSIKIMLDNKVKKFNNLDTVYI